MPKKIFAPAFDAAKWKALVEANRQRILDADSVEAFEGEVQKLITELKISHMAFFHQSFLKIPPNYSIGATFQAYGTNGKSNWMFQDVHEGGPAYLSNMRPGDLLLDVEGMPVAPPDITDIPHGRILQCHNREADRRTGSAASWHSNTQIEVASNRPSETRFMVQTRTRCWRAQGHGISRPSRDRRGTRNR